MQITTQVEYEAPLQRIHHLSGAPEGTREEKHLIRLVLAVEM